LGWLAFTLSSVTCARGEKDLLRVSRFFFDDRLLLLLLLLPLLLLSPGDGEEERDELLFFFRRCFFLASCLHGDSSMLSFGKELDTEPREWPCLEDEEDEEGREAPEDEEEEEWTEEAEDEEGVTDWYSLPSADLERCSRPCLGGAERRATGL
jgi:hypothetical protein